MRLPVRQLHEVLSTPTHLYIIIELATGGELFDRIIQKGHYTEADAAEVTRQIASALRYMHENGVAHRDLKPENVLYADTSAGAQVKVTDFGLAKVTEADTYDVMRTAVGTPGYVAPEILTEDEYGPEVDVWSLGVILYILLCGFPPFHDNNMQKLFQKITKGQFSFPSPAWDNISQEAKKLVQRMLIVDPAQRISVEEILGNPWVSHGKAARTNLRQTKELTSYQAQAKLKTAAQGVLAATRLNKIAAEQEAERDLRTG